MKTKGKKSILIFGEDSEDQVIKFLEKSRLFLIEAKNKEKFNF